MSVKQTTLNDKLHWYKDAIIYELHIKAFCDGNGDGIGDFEGLISKLDYLQELGVTAIWLLPFYPSPLKDDGYDIADYYHINPSYGTIKQFEKLMNEAHERNLKVITELVINHTSDQHPWFQRARKAPMGSDERNFYVWTDNPHQYRDVRIIFQDFETSNWTWDSIAKQYYWHRFFHHQPDLNYDNPLVQKEIFKILDYWCSMGVDGFRLDAVPYLFEREETNGENLPETHAFLKKLRKHVDKHFPGTLLLAEANMWPEDSASYFGDGDECQMNYHFPVMPRIFMALQMEDRYPITDIFDQTPAIPDSCQWAIFLRNHDELTLEMVTDEERDYMYKVYVKDPKAKINLGIRHRLAPLMDNNRKKIELLNYLLFSLPGTPVIYYGDEIGMGDNFYLGDRDGVRTPMQWDSGRNAGFSDANPQQLYLPLILDPGYHYETVNVERQSHHTSSLLWWTKRVISIRKKYKAFGRGNMTFIASNNSKILAFTRTYDDETILVIVNLSHYLQPVELELGKFNGHVPLELFSKNIFPGIKANNSYFLSLGPYDCQWFLLTKENTEEENKTLPVLDLKTWESLIEKSASETLENSILPSYLKNMRWFGGKGRAIQNCKIIEHVKIPLPENSVILLLIEVNYQSGLPEIYQLPVCYNKKHTVAKLQESFPKAIISTIKINGKEYILYDAVFEPAFQREIINRMASNKSIHLKDSELQFIGNKILKKYFVAHERIRSKVMSAEQSNTCIVYDQTFFMKIYRKVDRAINPDPELTRFLTNAGFKNIPAFAGTVEWKNKSGNIVLGMIQQMVKNNGDAWTFMLDKLKIYNETLLSKPPTELKITKLKGSLIKPLPYEEIPEEMKELLTAAVAETATLLGVRTGEMHLALASDKETAEFKPESFSLHYQRSLFSSFQSLIRATFQNQVNNLKKLPDDIRLEAENIVSMKEAILHTMKNIYRKKLDVVKIRTHGDYHLGQILITGKDLVILDFEGEPARTFSERRLKRSPLRDVAGMIRSFHYAAYGGLLMNDEIRKEDLPALLMYAEQWYHYMSGFFMKSYLETVKGNNFVPLENDDLEVLLETYLLEKAIYELNYELNNRPDWVLIPLRGIEAIMKKNKL